MSTRVRIGALAFACAMMFLVGTPSFGQTCVDGEGNVRAATDGCIVNGRRNKPCVGSSGRDLIIGTNGDDVIVAGGGRDLIFGRRGNDVICGDDGDDWIHAGWDDDVVHGGAGRDDIRGDFGDDIIAGGADADDIRGGWGDDKIFGEGGGDRIDGGFGDDEVHGGPGDDRIRGRFGRDDLRGGQDFDIVDGGPQTDFCEGEVLKHCEETGATPTATAAATDTPTAVDTPIPTSTSTFTATTTNTPTSTSTFTATTTNTPTSTSTFTATTTNTPTSTSTFTATSTSTPTSTSTFTATTTNTPTSTSTSTATSTYTPTSTNTAVDTATATATSTSTPTATPGMDGLVEGQVTDPAGLPLFDVSVSAGGVTTTTDAGGLYELDGLAELARVVVTFDAEGFSTTYGVVEFVPGGPIDLRLDRVMVPVSEPQAVDAQVGGSVEHNGSVVTFPAGSIDTIGTVEVVISTIDPTTGELGAFPGDYSAEDAGGNPVTLETFALFDVQITQGGVPINLATGETATLEFLLPVSTPLTLGESVALWFFDEATGLWFEESVGTVGNSSTTPGRLAVVGEVSHFSWWNCDRPITTFACLEGVVTDLTGNPVQGASVVGSGVDYSGSSYSATDASGAYCMNVRRDSTINVTASLLLGGAIQSQTVQLMSPVANVTCSSGGCATVSALQLSGFSCVAGGVLDEFGAPLSGRPVGSSGGGSSTSAPDGSFCLLAPADADVTLVSPGIAPLMVSTPSGGDCSTPTSCAQVVLQEAPGGSTSCLHGRVVDDGGGLPEFALSGIVVPGGDPVVGATVTAFDSLENTFGPVVTDANGEFCIPGVTAFSGFFLDVQGEVPDPFGAGTIPCFGFESDITTGAPGGTCSGGGCTELGDITCFGQLPS